MAGKIQGLCKFAAKLGYDKSGWLDPSWHEYFNKSQYLMGMLGRASAWRAKAGDADGVGGVVMRNFRNARKYVAALDEESGVILKPGQSESGLNAAIKMDVSSLVRDREALKRTLEELGYAYTDHATAKKIAESLASESDLDEAASRRVSRLINLVERTDVEDAQSTGAFESVRNLLSKSETLPDGTVKRSDLTDEGFAHFSNLLSGFKETEKLFRDPGFGLDFDAILNEFLKGQKPGSVYQGSFFEGMYDKAYGSFKHFLVSDYPPGPAESPLNAYANWSARIKSELADSGVSISDKALAKFVRDLDGGSMVTNFLSKCVMQMRPVNTSLKYFFGAGSGAQLTANSMVFNYGNLVTRVVGHRAVWEHKAVDKLLGMGFLSEQSRLGMDIDPDIAATGFNKMVDFLTGWVPGKAGKMAQDAVKTGIHAAGDWPFDHPAKRVAVMEALLKSKYGQSPADLDQFLKYVEDMPNMNAAQRAFMQRELDQLRGASVMAYDQFFTNSGFTGVSRNFFSDWLPFSALQGYMVKRASDVVRPIREALAKIARGETMDITKDPEFVRLVAAIAYIGKFGAMAGRALDQDDPEESAKHYALALNDYYQGIEGSFFMRLLTSPIRGWDHSVTLKDALGEEHTFVDGVSASAYALLSEAVSSAFKELRPLNSVSALVRGYQETGDFGFALNASKEEIDKVLTGMSRFNLQEGFETGGLKAIPEPDDWLSYFTMTKGEANKSLKIAIENRDMAEIEKWYSDKALAGVALFSQLPVLKHVFLADDRSGFSGTKYGEYARQMESDPDLNLMITEGRLPDSFFATPERVRKFWGELTKFDLSKMSVSKDGKSVPFSEGTHDAMKAELFIDRLAKKMGDGNLAKFLESYSGFGIESQQLARVLAFAENDVPGSSRVLISYAANKMLDRERALAKAASGQSKYDKTFTDVDDSIKAGVLGSLYPMLYVADKTSFAKAAVDYMGEKYPAYFKKDAAEGGKLVDDARNFTVSMALMDMAFAHEFKSGNPSANFVKNLFATASKYVVNPAHRMDLMNYALANVDTLPGTKEDKFALKLGVLAGNVDNMAAIAKDKVFSSNPDNELLLKEGLDMFWKGHAALNDTFRKDGVIPAINEDLRKTLGYQSDKKSYGGKRYDQARGKANDKAFEQYVKSVPKLTKNTPSWYKFPESGGYSAKFNPRSSWDGRPDYAKDPRWDAYMKQLGEARSQNIVTGYVEHFAGDKGPQPYAVSRSAPKWRQVAKAKIDLEKVRWKSARRF